MNMNFLWILKMVMNFKHKFAIVKNYRDRNLWCEVANIRKTIIYGGKQKCEQGQHWPARTCTMYMCVRQSENVYSKVQIQAANLQNQKFKTVSTDWLIGTFMAMLNRDVQKRIFTYFKTLGHEFSIYGFKCTGFSDTSNNHNITGSHYSVSHPPPSLRFSNIYSQTVGNF